MKPIPMIPAYRYGEMTPWGGNGLAVRYGRKIPDDRTGEGMEISAIPGLESRTPDGETLTDLIGRGGKDIAGCYDGKPFPLLLKLLCSKTDLSVQVHPDDDYASRVENKLGKTEAWVILHSEPDAGILYGIREGVTKAQLEDALLNGRDLEPLFNRVKVKPGDVYYMPAGMVHAIGGGIILYEIQQSSDVTYRLWDYDRVNEKGEKRPLRIAKSLDVVRPELTGQTAILPEAGLDECSIVLDVPAFRLDCLSLNGETKVEAEHDIFRILTALEPVQIICEDETFELASGDSMLIPAACSDMILKGNGRVLIALPPVIE